MNIGRRVPKTIFKILLCKCYFLLFINYNLVQTPAISKMHIGASLAIIVASTGAFGTPNRHIDGVISVTTAPEECYTGYV